MTRSPLEAIASVRAQSANGPRFATGMCKKKTREAYAVPSDGSKSASEAWARTDHRFDATKTWKPGAFAWWTGGSDGHGHVAILADKGHVWSVDILRPGYWDKVSLERISRSWPKLRLAGFSLDIDGVKVTNLPAAPTPHLDAAIRELLQARDARKASAAREKLDQAIALVRQVRGR